MAGRCLAGVKKLSNPSGWNPTIYRQNCMQKTVTRFVNDEEVFGTIAAECFQRCETNSAAA